MATLQADPSLAGFNCYSTVAEANDYHSKRLHNTAWTGALTATKETSLMWATRLLDNLQWSGARTNPLQDHEFPRYGLWTDGNQHSIGDYLTHVAAIDQNTIPLFLKEATAELAMQLISSDATQATGTEGFSKIKVDTIELAMAPRDRPSWLTDSVRNLCVKWLMNANKFTAPVRRVG